MTSKISFRVPSSVRDALNDGARRDGVKVEVYALELFTSTKHVPEESNIGSDLAVLEVTTGTEYRVRLSESARTMGMDIGRFCKFLLTTPAYVKDADAAGARVDATKPGGSVNPIIAPHVANSVERTQISKYHTKGGHGFAAEDANHLTDQLRGKRAKVVGQSNEAHGPDRLVNGVKVQSKYWNTPAASVNAAFDPKTGLYRYSGQVLEVPKDQYDQCVRLMEQRIRSGKVPGVTDPNKATDIVKSGSVTYKQARNIARAGNIDSLKFDAKLSCVEFGSSFGISFVIAYAQAKRGGVNNREAVIEALKASIASGANSFITGIVTRQLLRTQAAAIGAVGMRSGVRAVYSTSVGRAAVHRIAAGSLGRAVYGSAAVNHVAKLLRTNIVTSAAVVAITSGPDFYRAAFAGSISWRQFLKNATVNATGVVGGVGGWMAGAAVGAAAGSVIPGAGTAVGAVVGGIVGSVGGGIAARTVAGRVADRVVEDDSERMIEVINNEIPKLSHEYLLTQEEVDGIIKTIKDKVDAKWLRRMFTESDKGRNTIAARRYVCRELEPAFQKTIRRRPAVALPSVEEFDAGISELINEIDLPDEVAAD